MKNLKKKIESVIKSKGDGFYSFDYIVECHPEATYYMAFSERGNGKTTDMLKRCIRNYFEKGWQGAYIRRFATDFKAQRGDGLFTKYLCDYITAKSGGEWTDVYHAGTRWYFCRYDTLTKKDGSEITKKVINPDVFMYGFPLDAMEHDKGASFDRIHEIYFDEFLTRSIYLKDEFVLFNNVLSTIIRNKTDVKIFMAGNTVSKVACPYFKEMGLMRVKEQEQGTIDLYTYGDTLLKVAVEYCANRRKSKENEKYFAFGNPRLRMITSGAWEVAVHPHIPCRIRDAQKLFTFYIDFDDERMECFVAVIAGAPCLCVVAKTSDLKYPDDDLIYSDKYDNRPNWRRSIYRDTLPISKKLLTFVSDGRVLFSDNTTGEIFDGYMKWARANM